MRLRLKLSRVPAIAWGISLLAAVRPGFAPCLQAAELVPIPQLGLRVARGFRVTLWADAGMANDIRAMTLDPYGGVVVSGPDYIRILSDQDGDGIGDTIRDFAPLAGGARGLCWDEDQLYCVGEGALLRYTDMDGDGVADGPPERLLALETGEHGAHSLRKGPDGWWYLITGDQGRLAEEAADPAGSLNRRAEGGVLYRLAPDGRGAEAIAHGFFNPQGFDFNWLGDLFTCDTDVEADLFLPWHLPNRIYQIAHGGHHGSRSEARHQNQARPDYYADSVNILAPLGRGEPTGVVCYRHFQFPPHFRNGLFVLNWSLGRVEFTPLIPEGSGYGATPEVFLDSLGTHGFTPSDAVVAPDGSLLIAAGGRQTHGAVYRVDYAGGGPLLFALTNLLLTAGTEAHRVLNAPQPLEAWSRAEWLPAAQRIGPELFAQAMTDRRLAPSVRVRAVEILTEVFGALAPAAAAAGAQADQPFVRARVAWSLGRFPPSNFVPVIVGLARDPAPQVRLCALQSLADHATNLADQALQSALVANLTHPDPRVRRAAVRLARRVPETAWRALWAQRVNADLQSRLGIAFALLRRGEQTGVNVPVVETALEVLAQSGLPHQRLEAIRLLMLALGDYRLQDPSLLVYAPYEVAAPLQDQPELVARIRTGVGAVFPAGDSMVDFEAARLLAMVQDDAAETPAKVLRLITDRSPAASDFHYLTVLSRLRPTKPAKLSEATADALLSMDRKLEGQEVRGRLNWPVRLTEIVPGLLERDPDLADALLRHRALPSAGHVMLAGLLGPERYVPAARRFFDAVRVNPGFAWSRPLVDLLASLPAPEVRPLFRQQWSNVALRDELLLQLAQNPEVVDRDKFIAGLTSDRVDVTRACMSALIRLPPALSSQVIVPALRLLRRLLDEPGEQIARAQLLTLLKLVTSQDFRIRDGAASREELKQAYQPVFEWCALRYPGLNRWLEYDVQEDPAVWNLRFKAVNWSLGNPLRGGAVFRQRGCLGCHTGGTRLGPGLGGVARRSSPVELFMTIALPSHDVAPEYRPTLFRTRNGLSYGGLVLFEDHEVVILQTSTLLTLRLYQQDLVSRHPSPLSFMPAGLLKGLTAQEMADLYSHLSVQVPARW